MRLAHVAWRSRLAARLAHNVERLPVAGFGGSGVATAAMAVGELGQGRGEESAVLAEQAADDVGALLDERLGGREVATPLVQGGEQAQRLDALGMVVADRFAIGLQRFL